MPFAVPRVHAPALHVPNEITRKSGQASLFHFSLKLWFPASMHGP